MRTLVTGGAGFIGRWLVKQLLEDGHDVLVLDNESNGHFSNLDEFRSNPCFLGNRKGDIKDNKMLKELFLEKWDLCYHMAASINVQDSIDNPRETYENDSTGTFNVLENCRLNNIKLVFMSTCMVYDRAMDEKGIDETHPTKPASPYAGSKIAAENLVLSYWHAYRMPVVIVRPFNTYGPFQKAGGEGGVVSIFIQKAQSGQTVHIYGDGKQTRDLLYVEDCARFVAIAGYSDAVNGEIVNAGLGTDISINDLALLITGDPEKILHVKHIHPQSEVQKLLCNSEKANRLLGWKPQTSLTEGIEKTKIWLEQLKN